MKSEILSKFYDLYTEVYAKTYPKFLRPLGWDKELTDKFVNLYYKYPMNSRAVAAAYRQVKHAAVKLHSEPNMKLFGNLITLYSTDNRNPNEDLRLDFDYYNHFDKVYGYFRIPANDPHQ